MLPFLRALTESTQSYGISSGAGRSTCAFTGRRPRQMHFLVKCCRCFVLPPTDQFQQKRIVFDIATSYQTFFWEHRIPGLSTCRLDQMGKKAAGPQRSHGGRRFGAGRKKKTRGSRRSDAGRLSKFGHCLALTGLNSRQRLGIPVQGHTKGKECYQL